MPKLKRKSIEEPKNLYKKASKESLEEEERALFEAEKPLKVAESVLEGIEEDLAEQGITLFGNDNVEDDYLILPADITEVNSKELGRYFNAFTQQKMWTRTVIGRLSATVREMRRSMDDVKADVFAQQPAKMSVKEKELHFQIDSRARQILDDLFLYEEKWKMTSDYIANLEDAIILISREISRRSSDWEMEQRVDNVGKKRR